MKRVFVAIVMLGIAASSATEARATEELRNELHRLAEQVLKLTKNQPVTVGVFSPTGLPASNSGPGIEGILSQELEVIRPGCVTKDAAYEVKGDYAFAKSRDPKSEGLKIIQIKTRLIDKEFNEDILQAPLEAVFTGNNTIAQIVQPTVSLPPDGAKKERNEKIDAALREPSVFVDGTVVRSTPESPYAVEILVKPLGSDEPAQPREITDADGEAFVDLKREELYEVRVHNATAQEVAVALTIDGLDMFHFSQDRRDDGRPRYTHTIVYPRGYMAADNPKAVYDGTATIVGWHHALEGTENYLSFLVTEYGKGAISQTGMQARGNVGVIHVQFAHCRPLPEGVKPRSGNETGFGPPRTVKQKAVRFEIDPPHDFVSIRYSRP